MSAHFYLGCMNTSADNQNNATSRVLGSLKQTCKYLQIVADTCDASRHKRSHWNQTKVQKWLLLNIGSVDPVIGGEQRELCGHGQEGGPGGLGATVAIAAILFQRPSFIKPDKLLKELLSDRCWYAARKQPSVSVSESIGLLSRTRGRNKTLQWWRQL